MFIVECLSIVSLNRISIKFEAIALTLDTIKHKLNDSKRVHGRGRNFFFVKLQRNCNYCHDNVITVGGVVITIVRPLLMGTKLLTETWPSHDFRCPAKL